MEKEHKIDSTLGIGPMSSEVIEAVFRYSNYYRKPLMLIASKNQIDWRGGYVNGWKTENYKSFIDQMRQQLFISIFAIFEEAKMSSSKHQKRQSSIAFP